MIDLCQSNPLFCSLKVEDNLAHPFPLFVHGPWQVFGAEFRCWIGPRCWSSDFTTGPRFPSIMICDLCQSNRLFCSFMVEDRSVTGSEWSEYGSGVRLQPCRHLNDSHNPSYSSLSAEEWFLCLGVISEDRASVSLQPPLGHPLPSLTTALSAHPFPLFTDGYGQALCAECRHWIRHRWQSSEGVTRCVRSNLHPTPHALVRTSLHI